MKTGVELIAEERQRQIEVEGYSAQHDSQHLVMIGLQLKRNNYDTRRIEREARAFPPVW